MRFKVIYQLLLLFFIFVSGSKESLGQTGYTFSQTTQIYSSLTSGTTLATATTDSAGGAATSLNSYVGTLSSGTIPFVFYYNGTGYTGLFVSSNGFITFGTAPSATNVNPVSGTAAFQGSVSAFGRDLIGMFRKANPADPDTIARIVYQTLGTSPQRIFAIEWQNFRPTGTAPGGLGPAMSFQIRLHEGTNLCEIMYGPFTGGTWPNSSAQIGIRGSTNTVFMNRVLTSGQSWNNTTAGTLNTSTVAYTANSLPSNGLSFRFTSPPLPCQVPASLSVFDLQSTSVKLRWTPGSAGGATTSGYQVEWGSSGFVQGTGTLVNTTDTFLLINGLTSGNSYSFYVRKDCGNSNFSNWVGPKVFTAGQPAEACAEAVTLTVASSLATCNSILVSSGQSQNGPTAICSDGLGGNTPDDDRWYKFIAPSNGKKIVITTTAGTVNDWVMEIWTSCPSGVGQVIACADDVNGGAMPEIQLCQNQYTAGQMLYVRVWTYSTTANGNMNLCVYETTSCPIPPSNDECSNASFFPINPVQYCPGNELTFSTLYATVSGVGGSLGAAPSCDASTSISDVWLGFNTGTSGDFKVTFALGTATALKAQLLFECGGGGFEIQCFPNAIGTFTITGLNPSANYVFRVWSPAGQSGTFTVCAQDLCDDPSAVISGAASICSTGVASLRVDLTGLSPWTVSYTDGSVVQSFTTSTTPYFINVSPVVTTFYNLVSVSGPICFGTVSGVASVSMLQPPTVTLSQFNSTVCSNTNFTLSGGSPSGGFYSGIGVNGNQFDASIAGPGTHPITYTYGFGNGCQRSETKSIVVIPGPKIQSFTPSSGFTGSSVSITGSGFAGVSTVRFNNISAGGFTVTNSQNIIATVPAGTGNASITVQNSNGCTGTSQAYFTMNGNPVVQLSVKAFIEGFYSYNSTQLATVNPQTYPTLSDTVTIALHQSISPYTLLTSAKTLLSTSGFASVTFSSVFANSSYYITIKNRNSVETWIKNPVLLVPGSNFIDFTGTSGSSSVSGQRSMPVNSGFQQASEIPFEKPEHPE